jgi:sugar phosphate isomerase/epimerase
MNPMNRRHFLQTATGATLGGLSMALLGCESKEAVSAPSAADTTATPAAGTRALSSIGVQLYTLRSLMETDFMGTIERVAAIGYNEVEFAGYFDHTARDVMTLLDRLNLRSPSSHIGFAAVEDGTLGNVLEFCKAIDNEYAIVAWVPEDRRTPDDWKRWAEAFNRAGEAARALGLKFAYHNHDFEFMPIEGQAELPYDLLMAELDPALVTLELDLFWITKAGQNPQTYFDRYPGRFELCHVKDMGPNQTMVDVGQGQIDFATIFAAGNSGLKHFIVEHDDPADPVQTITNSYQHLKQLRF